MHAGSLEMTLNLRYAIRYLHRDVTHTTEFVTSTSLAAFQFYGVISMCVCACVCTWGVTASGQLNTYSVCNLNSFQGNIDIIYIQIGAENQL